LTRYAAALCLWQDHYKTFQQQNLLDLKILTGQDHRKVSCLGEFAEENEICNKTELDAARIKEPPPPASGSGWMMQLVTPPLPLVVAPFTTNTGNTSLQQIRDRDREKVRLHTRFLNTLHPSIFV
jgi:hypothetical protein